MANNAFDAMNGAAGNDMYITGGAITMSEYEQNMTPGDQSRYENLLVDSFMTAYQRDPYKQNLDFKHWLKTLNPELIRERALKFEDVRASNNGLRKLAEREDGRLLEDAGMVQRLAHLHTGRVEDLIEIIDSMDLDSEMMMQPMQPMLASV